MKKEFSKEWIASSQTRKQRKYRANAPLHIKRNFLASNLTKELRKKHGMRNVEVRKGDNVKIMRGEFKKKTGKVADVDIKMTRLTVEGLQRKKKDGTKINIYFHPSNVQITNLAEDKQRFAAPKAPELKEQKTESKETKSEAKAEKGGKNAPNKK
jgi:large subunit ribosomal protein L24